MKGDYFCQFMSFSAMSPALQRSSFHYQPSSKRLENRRVSSWVPITTLPVHLPPTPLYPPPPLPPVCGPVAPDGWFVCDAGRTIPPPPATAPPLPPWLRVVSLVDSV